MKTRSQTAKELNELEVNIDFDYASKMWNANKKKLLNGCYQYVCGKELNNSCFCKRKLAKNSPFCYVHNKK